MRRAAGVAAVTVALMAAAAASASAAPDWNFGLPEELYEQTCASIGAGGLIGYQEELGTSVRAGMYVDPQNIPKVGEVFYGGVMIAAVGGCSDKSAIPEVVPPAGVELAVSAANPVRCHYTLPDGSDTAITAGCPQAPKPGPHGGFSIAPDGDPGNAWTGIGKIPGTEPLTRPQLEILYIEFPLRASRPLTGLPGGPSCPSRAGRIGPCPRDAAGDFLQVAVQVFSLAGTPTLVPAIGLFAEPGLGGRPAPTPPGTAGGPAAPGPQGDGGDGAPRVIAPRSVRIRRALAGIRASVEVPADGARVTATLRARRIGRIAVVRRARVKAGRLTFRLKPTRAAARRLRRASRVTATLRVTVRIPGQATTETAIVIRLRR